MKLYTKTICPRCMWIKSELQRREIQAEIINIDHDEQARERLIAEGLMGVPVMETDGRWISDPEEMMQQLERYRV